MERSQSQAYRAMSTTYLIQFVAGAQDLVRESLAHAAPDCHVRYEDDSAMVFEASTRITSAAQLAFANNVFVVLATTPRREIARSVRQLTALVGRAPFPPIKGASVGFRVMFHIDGALAAVDRPLRVALEGEIARRTRSNVESRGSCAEYWVIGRRDLGDLLLAARLPKPSRPGPAKGALAPELCEMLIAASRPRAGDTFLDPFAGSGAIVQARLRSPAKSVIYADIALPTFRPALPREVQRDRRLRLFADDARHLPSIGDGEVDVIVTDPPWGEFEQLPVPYGAFAEQTARSFDRVLDRRTGRFVVLSARRNAVAFTEALTGAGFTIRASPGILINGHPATVLIGGRTPGRSNQPSL